MDHLGALADRPLNGQSHWPSRWSILRFLPYGVVWPQEDFRSLCCSFDGFYFHSVLRKIATGAFGWGVAGWTGMVASVILRLGFNG
jgi:hypothetical protein